MVSDINNEQLAKVVMDDNWAIYSGGAKQPGLISVPTKQQAREQRYHQYEVIVYISILSRNSQRTP